MASFKRLKTYKQAGVDVDSEDEALKRVVYWCHKTYAFREEKTGMPVLPIAHFAGIIKINSKMGLVLKTDGVGTKIFIAQLMNKYDTVGIDCVAMNVNDVLCVGAEPVSFVDYIAVQKPHLHLLEEIARGLALGAEKARVSIVGGEIAQVPEMLRGKRQGYNFDLVGMCVGAVPIDNIIKGDRVTEGDVVLGLQSSGIHSNGLTLARRVLLGKGRFSINDYVDKLGRTLGEELIEPTRIYVPEVLAMLKAGVEVKAMANITGKGLLNLMRIGRGHGFGYRLDTLPKPQAIFELIQERGKIADEEMYRIYNMGIGFCLVLPKRETDKAQSIAEKHKVPSRLLGKAVRDPEERLVLKPRMLVSVNGYFQRLSSRGNRH